MDQWSVGFAGWPCPDALFLKPLGDGRVLSICALSLRFLLRNLFNKHNTRLPEIVQDMSVMPGVSVLEQ